MKFTLSPNPKLISTFLLKIVATLLLLDLIACYAKSILGYSKDEILIRLVDLRREANLPTVYSTLAIWLCAVLLWQIHVERKKNNKTEAARWKVMSFVFLFLGCDELLLIHERTKGISTYLNAYIHLPVKDLFWTISYGFLLVPLAVYFFRFYLQLPKATRIQFTIAGIVYVGGAIGMEFMGGIYVKQFLKGTYDSQPGLPAFVYDLFVAVEEVMEMLGIVLFVRALLNYIRTMPSYPVLTVALEYKSNSRKTPIMEQRKVTLASSEKAFSEQQ